MKASFTALVILVLATSAGCRTVSCSSPLSSFLFGTSDGCSAPNGADGSTAHGYNLWDESTPGGTGCQQACATNNYWEASCGCESGFDGCSGSSGNAAAACRGGATPTEGWSASDSVGVGHSRNTGLAKVVDALPRGMAPITNSFEIGDGCSGEAAAAVVSEGGPYGPACPRCGTGRSAAAAGGCRACGHGLARAASRRMLAASGHLNHRAVENAIGAPARMAGHMAHTMGSNHHLQAVRQKTAQHCANGPCNLPPGPQSGAVAYPYYTIRGPRDFLMSNPPSIGP